MDGVKEMNSTKKKILSTLVEALSCLPYFALAGVIYVVLDSGFSVDMIFRQIFQIIYFVFPFGATTLFFNLSWLISLVVCTYLRIQILKKGYSYKKTHIFFLLILPVCAYSIMYLSTTCKNEKFPIYHNFVNYIGFMPHTAKYICRPFGYEFILHEEERRTWK